MKVLQRNPLCTFRCTFLGIICAHVIFPCAQMVPQLIQDDHETKQKSEPQEQHWIGQLCGWLILGEGLSGLVDLACHRSHKCIGQRTTC